jgi:hypothetical protein
MLLRKISGPKREEAEAARRKINTKYGASSFVPAQILLQSQVK